MAQPQGLQCNVRFSFATVLKTWRLKNKLPLKKIAGDLGVAVATIDAWELGRRFPTAHNFEKLVRYSGLPPCKLLCMMAEKCVREKCLLAKGTT